MNTSRALTVALFGLIPFSAVTQASTCNDAIKVSSPTPRFSVTDGEVFDRRTELRWMRCPVGYRYEDNDTDQETRDDACVADSDTLLDWAGALAAAEAINTAAAPGEPNDWRVPNIKELLSIAERRCVNPAINAEVFPQPASTFVPVAWSATYSTDTVSGPRAYALDFGNGSPSLRSREADAFLAAVYLVR